jgi:tetratricopeptide (TPR) repeat protein
MGHVEDAEQAILRAIECEPTRAQFYFHCASVLQVLGRTGEAETYAAKGLALDPSNPGGLALFGTVHKYKEGSVELARLETALAGLLEADGSAQITLLHAKARALEDLKQIPAAFAYYAAVGRMKLRQHPYSPGGEDKVTEGMRQVFTPAYVSRDRSGPHDRCQSDSPVFVVGMPRSGTSLLEQVLSSHSQVAGIGEQKIVSYLLSGVKLDDRFKFELNKRSYWPPEQEVSIRERGEKYVEEAAKAARKQHYRRTVDKMPPNYRNVGLILDMLPNAQVIHSMRHPIETCVSCYRILFAEGHHWSYDLKHLGAQYRRYYDIMSFWAEMFGDKILHVRYEDMVDDLEAQARRLFRHIGLEFEPQCLNFHENPNPMRTASVLQVRQPLYRSSVDKWRKHHEILRPLYEEIQDIVDLYERREGLFALARQKS